MKLWKKQTESKFENQNMKNIAFKPKTEVLLIDESPKTRHKIYEWSKVQNWYCQILRRLKRNEFQK